MFILESLKDTFFKLSFPIEKQKSTPTASGNYGHLSLKTKLFPIMTHPPSLFSSANIV